MPRFDITRTFAFPRRVLWKCHGRRLTLSWYSPCTAWTHDVVPVSHRLGLYSLMAVVLLLGQGLLVLAFFADAAWQRRLPHDQTGEAARLEHWIKARMAVCQWVALGVLLLQVPACPCPAAASPLQCPSHREWLSGWGPGTREAPFAAYSCMAPAH